MIPFGVLINQCQTWITIFGWIIFSNHNNVLNTKSRYLQLHNTILGKYTCKVLSNINNSFKRCNICHFFALRRKNILHVYSVAKIKYYWLGLNQKRIIHWMYSTNLREMISSCASACVSVRTQRKFKEFKFFDQTTIFTSLKRITFFKHNWEKKDGVNR